MKFDQQSLLFLHIIFILLLAFELLFFPAKSHPRLFSKDMAHCTELIFFSQNLLYFYVILGHYKPTYLACITPCMDKTRELW